ncbi:MAG: caspase domain-containing protein [Fimbriimonadales bacterium]
MKAPRLFVFLSLLLWCSAAPGQNKNLIQTQSGDPKARPLYANSHALIIGINRYPNLPSNLQLSYGVKDAADLRDELTKDYGFPASNVTLLTDDKASLQGIRDALAALTDNTKIKTDDRVLIFFSGHGQTVPTPSGGEMGYLIPSDARVDLNDPSNAGPYNASCLRMKEIWDDLDGCPAKHVLVIADACFSGLLVKSRGGLSKDSIAAMLAKPARQIISGGDKGQTTSERSDLGHGVFTSKLLNHLKSHATEKGRVFAASQLFGELLESVSNATNGKQTPKFGAFDTDGEFLFAPGGVMDATIPGQRADEQPSSNPADPAGGGIAMRMRPTVGQVLHFRLTSQVNLQGIDVSLTGRLTERRS